METPIKYRSPIYKYIYIKQLHFTFLGDTKYKCMLETWQGLEMVLKFLNRSISRSDISLRSEILGKEAIILCYKNTITC